MGKVDINPSLTIGDIICVGKQSDITTQSDLDGKEYYNITDVKVNNFGNNPHIYLGAN